MSLSNTELAEKMVKVINDHQTLVTETRQWSISTEATVDFTDPITGLSVAIKTPYQMGEDFNQTVGNASSELAQATQLLTDANVLNNNAVALDATFSGYVVTAQTAAIDAETHKDAAALSETNAANSATAASNSEDEASASEINASNSATVAVSAATDLANAVSQAQASANSAGVAADNALNEATDALSYKNLAALSATNAFQSDVSSTASAANASNSETNAANSASSANTSAVNAAASAASASNSETVCIDNRNISTSAANAASTSAAEALSIIVESFGDTPIRGWAATINGPTDEPTDILHTNQLNSQEKIRISYTWTLSQLESFLVETSVDGGTSYTNAGKCNINYTNGSVTSWNWT